jgi:hypothetical protein
MSTSTRLTGHIALMTALVLSLSGCSTGGNAGAGDHAVRDCNAIAGEIHQNHIDAEGKGWATIALREHELTVANLVCVATRLGRTHPEWKDVRVRIFDSQAAAENYSADWKVYQGGARTYALRQRGNYIVRRQQGEEYLDLRLFTLDEDRFETRIDLPIDGQPSCRFEVATRCLLVVGDPAWSDAILQVDSGEVNVEANVDPKGHLTQLRVVDEGSLPEAVRGEMSQAVRAHLTTWRFDPAPGTDTARFRYTFLKGSLPASTSLRATPSREGSVITELKSATDITVHRQVYR